jgi:polyisoprenoid-binding protein YceI
MRALKPIVCLLLAIASCPVAAERWRLDPVHSRIAFVVDHAGLSRAIGTFAGVHGRLDFDPGDWRDARVEATVPLASLDLGDDDWARKVLDGTFLDAADHPLARFVSSSVEPAADGTARIAGTLTLRGVSRPVVLDARLNAAKRHPITRRRTVGFSATAELDREAFGIDAWPNVIGKRIEVLIEVEAILDARADPGSPPAVEPADAAVPQH